ncbi:MAG: hypothetical protein NE327_06340 [Lentisphaeraceae bacterium]|nr:hypothetical protein [Lentisphaeraceae bacterium]
MASTSISKNKVDNANRQVAAQDYGIANQEHGQIGEVIIGRGAKSNTQGSFGLTLGASARNNNISEGGHISGRDLTIYESVSDNELQLFKYITDSNKELFTQATDAFSASATATINRESPVLEIFDKVKIPVFVLTFLWLLTQMFSGGKK